jgi:hypothetical protein
VRWLIRVAGAIPFLLGVVFCQTASAQVPALIPQTLQLGTEAVLIGRGLPALAPQFLPTVTAIGVRGVPALIPATAAGVVASPALAIAGLALGAGVATCVVTDWCWKSTPDGKLQILPPITDPGSSSLPALTPGNTMYQSSYNAITCSSSTQQGLADCLANAMDDYRDKSSTCQATANKNTPYCTLVYVGVFVVNSGVEVRQNNNTVQRFNISSTKNTSLTCSNGTNYSDSRTGASACGQPNLPVPADNLAPMAPGDAVEYARQRIQAGFWPNGNPITPGQLTDGSHSPLDGIADLLKAILNQLTTNPAPGAWAPPPNSPVTHQEALNGIKTGISGANATASPTGTGTGTGTGAGSGTGTSISSPTVNDLFTPFSPTNPTTGQGTVTNSRQRVPQLFWRQRRYCDRFWTCSEHSPAGA